MIERFLQGLAPMLEEPVDGAYLAVTFPGDMDPFERHYRYGMMLDAELRMAGFGCASGGGTMYSLEEEDEEGEPQALFTVVDIESTDIDGARRVIRDHLPELGCPAGTLIQFGEREDRYDGERWHLGEPRSFEEE